MPNRYDDDDKKRRRSSGKDLSKIPNNPTSVLKKNYGQILEFAKEATEDELKDYLIRLLEPCVNVYDTMDEEGFKKFIRNLDDAAYPYNKNKFGKDTSYKKADKMGKAGIISYITNFVMAGIGNKVIESLVELEAIISEQLKGQNLEKMDFADADDMQDHGEPLGKKLKNHHEETPIIKGTGKGMDGKKQFRENLRRLNNHFSELANRRFSKYSILVREADGRYNRTKPRPTLAEAIVDMEEVLQLHNHTTVVLEAHNVKGIKSFAAIPVKKRAPIVSEGKSLFRFNRTAEASARLLIREGLACTLKQHNWGYAVTPKKK